ncbi:MAG: hypothetical protein ACI8UO_006616 [Verrucomicrobiales bacterium]|jgi:hypothetical protein
MPNSIQPDPVLAQHSAAIEQRLVEAVNGLTTEDLEQLLGAVGREMVSVTIAALQADSASIWLADAARTKLVVCHSEPNNGLLEREQPLNEGLISLVLGSEKSICQNQVYKNAQHSKRIDSELAQITCSMIAAPFYAGGQLRGVLSCVKLKDSLEAPDPPIFTAANLSRITRLSSAMERLLNYRILTRILDLEI